MGRYARQAIADIPYHITNRGNNHQSIFFCNDDYRFFLEAIERAKEEYPCRIFSFVLMTNHFHFLLESMEKDENLALFMKQVAQRYGQYINKKYTRTGTLWEGRFKSSPVSTDRYLLACSRYIEMNPVRAGIVGTPGEYHFSSYGAKTGSLEFPWLDRDPVYLSLGATEAERQKEYKKWFNESIPEGELPLIRESIRRNWPYGNEQFKKEVEDTLGRKFEIKRAGRKTKEKRM